VLPAAIEGDDDVVNGRRWIMTWLGEAVELGIRGAGSPRGVHREREVVQQEDSPVCRAREVEHVLGEVGEVDGREGRQLNGQTLPVVALDSLGKEVVLHDAVVPRRTALGWVPRAEPDAQVTLVAIQRLDPDVEVAVLGDIEVGGERPPEDPRRGVPRVEGGRVDAQRRVPIPDRSIAFGRVARSLLVEPDV